VIFPGQSNDELVDIITTDELVATAKTIAALQLPNGMIPWFPNGHCDPWNHVETAMALDVMGMHDEARRAYAWLADIQRPDGSWHNYYMPDGSLEDAKLDTNVCAYIATGIWHHYLVTSDEAFIRVMWPTVKRALTWVLGMRKDDGTILWACEVDSRPWNYSLLTGSSSIRHALHSGRTLEQSLAKVSQNGEQQPTLLTTSLALIRPCLSRNCAGPWTGTTPSSLAQPLAQKPKPACSINGTSSSLMAVVFAA
jgi:hypothetical protein